MKPQLANLCRIKGCGQAASAMPLLFSLPFLTTPTQKGDDHHLQTALAKTPTTLCYNSSRHLLTFSNSASIKHLALCCCFITFTSYSLSLISIRINHVTTPSFTQLLTSEYRILPDTLTNSSNFLHSNGSKSPSLSHPLLST